MEMCKYWLIVLRTEITCITTLLQSGVWHEGKNWPGLWDNIVNEPVLSSPPVQREGR